MPINHMFWSGNSARDLHVLRGQSTRDLTFVDLAFRQTDGTLIFSGPYLGANHDVTLEFRPLFRVANETPTEFFGHGIHVEKTTGAVRVEAALPPLRKRNFIMEVTARNIGDGSTFTETIRVHVHASLVRAWLTPPRLAVRPSGAPRPETTNYRFTVRAEFDDGVTGDITVGHEVVWGLPPNVTPDGRLIINLGDAEGAEFDIVAMLPATLPGTNPRGRFRVVRAWTDEPSPPTATIVPGGGWPGIVNPALVPNVLFLGDGFMDGDRTAFERITNGMIQHLKKDRLVRPFDVLATSINFWRAFEPAAARAISVRSEVFVYAHGTKLLARPLPTVARPPAAGALTLEQLVYVAGLPVPGDEARTVADIRGDWTAQLDPDPGPRVSDALVGQWKMLAKRGFIDEVDAFPAMSLGDAPRANAFDNALLGLHPDRGHTPELRRFFGILAEPQGVVPDGGTRIGDVWAQNTFRFDSTELVVLVSAVPCGRAVNGPGFIAVSTRGFADLPVTKVTDRNAFTLNVSSVLDKVEKDICRTVAHEIAHSFGIQDEYAEQRRDRFPFTEAQVDGSNVQSEADARNAAGDIDAAQIKWTWHRIRKAGVVAAMITPAATAGQFAVPVDLGHGLQFVKGDTVLLRQRTWGQRILKGARVLAKTLRVAEKPTTDRVVVEAAPGEVVSDADFLSFLPGSLLFVPVLSPTSLPAPSPFAELVANNIKKHITDTKGPLTPVPCVPVAGPEPSPVQTPKLGGVKLPCCFKHKNRVVGLYSGGMLFACGIFHPTGTCMMRNSHSDHSEFCAVCRYIVVDLIDPRRHFEIDRDYADIYPFK